MDGAASARMPSHAYGYVRSYTDTLGMSGRQIPWKPSHPAITSQDTWWETPDESTYESTGRSDSTPDTATSEAENSMTPPSASRAAIRSLTISVCA